jgi:hypothetical protein
MNEENLIPFSERSKEEARTLGRKGGIKSGESRRQRKTLKEELLLLLAEGDTQKNISVALIQQALEGNTKAFEVIRDSIGEKQVEQTELINKEINVVIK